MRVISGKARGTKLSSIDSLSTRPTLDRVKESLFNIIQNRIPDSNVLDLFAGSGAIGIEFISRGCKQVYFCEREHLAFEMIKQNLNKTNFREQAKIIKKDYRKCLQILEEQKMDFDIIYIDPPYKENLACDAVERIVRSNLIKEEGIIIIETDEENRELEELKKLQVEVYDLRRYGRVSLIFLSRKG